jgi:hypothetical protein
VCFRNRSPSLRVSAATLISTLFTVFWRELTDTEVDHLRLAEKNLQLLPLRAEQSMELIVSGIEILAAE